MRALTKFLKSNMLERNAEVAELVDALGSGSSGVTPVGVRVPSSAPTPRIGIIEGLLHFAIIPVFQYPGISIQGLLGFVGRLKSDLKKSVEVFNEEGSTWVGSVPSLKHSRMPSFPKLT